MSSTFGGMLETFDSERMDGLEITWVIFRKVSFISFAGFKVIFSFFIRTKKKRNERDEIWNVEAAFRSHTLISLLQALYLHLQAIHKLDKCAHFCPI